MNAVLLWAIVPALYLIREVLRARRDRYWAHELRRLQWRERFADIRGRSVKLIAADQLDPRSSMAEMLYQGSSALVRRARDYDAFAHGLLYSLVSENIPDESKTKRLKREFESASPEVRELVAQYVHSAIELACQRSWLVRWYFNAEARRQGGRSRSKRTDSKGPNQHRHGEMRIVRGFRERREFAHRAKHLEEIVGASC